MADLKAFAEQLVNLSVKEVNELAEILKNEYGIEPAAAAVADTTSGNVKSIWFEDGYLITYDSSGLFTDLYSS